MPQLDSCPPFTQPFPLQLILAAINAARPGLLRAWRVESVPRAFHATFKARQHGMHATQDAHGA